MQHNSKSFFLSLLLTTALLIISEVLVSTLFPLIGLIDFRISFVTVIVLYLAFFYNNILIAPLIAYFYLIHGVFSLEHWSMGALSTLMVSIVISFLRNLIHLNSFFVTFVFVQLFQILIFIINSFLMSLKVGSFQFLGESLTLFILESLTISAISPLIFSLLKRIWAIRGDDIEEANA
jgi:hypothetical protein